MSARRFVRAYAAALGVLLPGCASQPALTEADRARIHKVAVVFTDRPTTIVVHLRTHGAEETNVVQAAAEEEMARRLKASDWRAPLAAALRAELAAGGFEAVFPAPNGATERADATLEVSARAIGMVGGGVARIMVRGSNELLAELRLLVHARVTDATDSRAMPEIELDRSSGFFPLEDWVATRGGRLEAAQEELIRRLAADIVDLALREYRPPPPAGGKPSVDRPLPAGNPDFAQPTPLYRIHALRAAALPPARANPFNRNRPRYGYAGALTPSEADSVRPVLEWERFPRPYAWAPESTVAAGIREVTYELRIYSSTRQADPNVLEPERVIYERSGLVEPAHALEIGLESCEVYFWTARARFSFVGRVRVTPWTGAWWGGMFAFATPALPGKEHECAYGK